jgi:hypothetical protein
MADGPGRRNVTARSKCLRWRRLGGVALVALILAGGCQGFSQTPPDYRLNKDFLTGFGRDFAAVVTSPLHWGGRDLGRLAIVSAGTLTLVAFDPEIRDWAQDHKTDSSDEVSQVFEKIGSGAYLLGFSAALYAAGEIWHSRGLRKTALLSVESLATASALAAVMKFVVGRARPYTGEGSLSFHMFSTESAHNSFPSGHTVAAFAVATTIAEQTRGMAVDILAYSVATLVGLSRIHDDKHWASSVLAGGALGYFVAKKINARHRSGEPSKSVQLGVQLGPECQALTLTYAF